MDIVRIIL